MKYQSQLQQERMRQPHDGAVRTFTEIAEEWYRRTGKRVTDEAVRQTVERAERKIMLALAGKES